MLNNFYIFSTCSETTFCLNPVESNILYWFTEEHIKYNCNLIQFSKENWIEGGGFAVTFSDCWRTRFCVTTITKIVNNNTNDKQTSGISGALDEDSPYTNSYVCYIRSAAFCYCCYAQTSSSAVQKRHSKVYGNPIAPPSIQFSLQFSVILLFKKRKKIGWTYFFQPIQYDATS